MAIRNKGQKARFLAVGGFNTALDFGILFGLNTLGMPLAIANIISTTIAFIFSFFANKKFAFKSKGTNLKREITSFIVVTLFGLWVIQSSIIFVAESTLDASSLNLGAGATLIVAKLLATCGSVTWNYYMYSRVVFKDTES